MSRRAPDTVSGHNEDGGLTLAEAISTLEDEGFKAQFATRDAGRVLCLTCRAEHEAAAVELDRIVRLEGTTDPADEIVVAGVVCPSCLVHGTLTLSFGPEASAEDAIAFRDLHDDRVERR